MAILSAGRQTDSKVTNFSRIGGTSLPACDIGIRKHVIAGDREMWARGKRQPGNRPGDEVNSEGWDRQVLPRQPTSLKLKLARRAPRLIT